MVSEMDVSRDGLILVLNSDDKMVNLIGVWKDDYSSQEWASSRDSMIDQHSAPTLEKYLDVTMGTMKVSLSALTRAQTKDDC